MRRNWWTLRNSCNRIWRRTNVTCCPCPHSKKRMISKNWSRRSVLACGVISLLASGAAAQSPAIALVDPADAEQWEMWAKEAGWKVIAGGAAGSADARIQALAPAVRDAIRN